MGGGGAKYLAGNVYDNTRGRAPAAGTARPSSEGELHDPTHGSVFSPLPLHCPRQPLTHPPPRLTSVGAATAPSPAAAAREHPLRRLRRCHRCHRWETRSCRRGRGPGGCGRRLRRLRRGGCWRCRSGPRTPGPPPAAAPRPGPDTPPRWRRRRASHRPRPGTPPPAMRRRGAAPGRSRKVPEGPGRSRKVPEGPGRSRKVPEGPGR
jgi:hypothetical protein